MNEADSLKLIAETISGAKKSFNRNGSGAILWGVVIALCSFIRYAEITFHFQLPFNVYLLTLVAIAPQIFITLREKREAIAQTYDDSYLDAIWLAFGISIFLLNVVLGSMESNFFSSTALSQAPEALSAVDGITDEYIASFFLILYGLPTFVTGAAGKVKSMLWGGIACWVLCIVTLYTSFAIDLLLTALAAIVAWLIPGILLNKESRQRKFKTESLDV